MKVKSSNNESQIVYIFFKKVLVIWKLNTHDYKSLNKKSRTPLHWHRLDDNSYVPVGRCDRMLVWLLNNCCTLTAPMNWCNVSIRPKGVHCISLVHLTFILFFNVLLSILTSACILRFSCELFMKPAKSFPFYHAFHDGQNSLLH